MGLFVASHQISHIRAAAANTLRVERFIFDRILREALLFARNGAGLSGCGQGHIMGSAFARSHYITMKPADTNGMMGTDTQGHNIAPPVLRVRNYTSK